MRSHWQLDEKTQQKYELAERFGLMDALRRDGWAGLSAKDSGRIGGCMRGRKRPGQEQDH